MEENEEENEYEDIDFWPEEEGKAERSRKKKGFQLTGDSDDEVVGEQGPQQQRNTWQQRVAKLFRWVPQFPEIPWRTSKKTQHNEKSVSPPSQFVTRSEKSNRKDNLCVTSSELSSCKDKSYVTRSELSSCKDKSHVTRSEPSSCKDKAYVTRSELLKHQDKDLATNCDSSRLSNMQNASCPRTNIQDGMKRRTDGDSTGQEEVCPECPPPPLTTHQTRVLKSLEKINIPSWFRPVNKPTRHRQSQHTDKPQWKRSQEPTVRSNDEPTSHWLSSRETSACPSFSSAYSQLSSTRQAYRSPRGGSIQSWQAPTTCSYKEPYIGWRSHKPHQEREPYLLPPPQRLANSTSRDGGSQVDLLANMG